jgi:hypothetical protein
MTGLFKTEMMLTFLKNKKTSTMLANVSIIYGALYGGAFRRTYDATQLLHTCGNDSILG